MSLLLLDSVAPAEGVTHELEGNAAGSSSLDGQLVQVHGLEAAALGLSWTSAAASIVNTLQASAAGQGTLQTTFSVLRSLSGATEGEGLLVGPLQYSHSLFATVAGVGTVEASLSLSRACAGTAAGTSVLQGSLTGYINLQATAAGAGTLVGSLSRVLALQGTAEGESWLTLTVLLPAVASPRTRTEFVLAAARIVYVLEDDDDRGFDMVDPKDPNDVIDYTINYSAWLGDDTIVSSELLPPLGLEIDSDTFNTSIVVLWTSGGTRRNIYPVRNHIVTAGGRHKYKTIYIAVEDQ